MSEAASIRDQRAEKSSGRAALVSSALCFALLTILSGCNSIDGRIQNPSRLDKGYTIYLPGILGRNFWDNNLAQSLADSDVQSAVEIYDWTQGPHMMAFNVFNAPRRERETNKIVEKIIQYQDRYPGRPVYLIGHSGGAGMTVKVLESLPEDRKVTGGVLLAAALSQGYDLRKAQSHTERGLHNFYSNYDIMIGQGVTTAMGATLRGGPGSAAMFGFTTPDGLTRSQRQRYERWLTQHEFSWDMLANGHTGGHFGWTSPSFVRDHIAPIVRGDDGSMIARQSKASPAASTLSRLTEPNTPKPSDSAIIATSYPFDAPPTVVAPLRR